MCYLVNERYILNQTYKVPVTQWPFGLGTKVGYDINLAQSLNLANTRSRYFLGENHIRTTVNNINPQTNTLSPSTTFDDNIMMNEISRIKDTKMN